MHFCTVLWGFTAILGKAISLRALPLVWWRMLLVACLLAAWPGFWRGMRAMSPRLIAIYAGIGAVIALHWVTFYESIKLANASVAATCMALAPISMAFIEPVVARSRFDAREVWLGVAAVPAGALVIGGTPAGMRAGIAVGVVSAFAAALFGALNKRFLGSSNALVVTGIEMVAGVVAVSVFSLALRVGVPWVLPGTRDAVLLVSLAVGCTLVPFALWLVVLRQLSAFTSALIINMEPVYAVGLASVLLGEQRELSITFYAGVMILVGVVFGHPLWLRRAACPALNRKTWRACSSRLRSRTCHHSTIRTLRGILRRRRQRSEFDCR